MTKKSECSAAGNLDWPDSTDNIALNALTVNNDEDNHGKDNNDEDNHGKRQPWWLWWQQRWWSLYNLYGLCTKVYPINPIIISNSILQQFVNRLVKLFRKCFVIIM